jgi:hypothetical protein
MLKFEGKQLHHIKRMAKIKTGKKLNKEILGTLSQSNF